MASFQRWVMNYGNPETLVNLMRICTQCPGQIDETHYSNDYK